jgi:hypothetical protein
MSMKYRVIILVFFLCTAAVPAITVSGDYMGGTIELSGSGIKITQTTATATQATTARVPPTTMPESGSLSVTTTPAGATVFIDNVQRGVSPAIIPSLSPGSHILLLKLDGYKDLSIPVTITAGQTATFTTGLSPLAAADAVTPALPKKKTPGFVAVAGLAALGAVLWIRKSSR